MSEVGSMKWIGMVGRGKPTTTTNSSEEIIMVKRKEKNYSMRVRPVYEDDLHLQVQTKKAFGRWQLSVWCGGEQVVIPISKKKALRLMEFGVSSEG